MSEPEHAMHSLVLLLSPTMPVAVGETVGHQAHAAFLRTIQEVAPELAEDLHAPGVQQRPFTVSPLLGVGPAREGQVALSPADTYYLRVTLLAPDLYSGFMARFLRSGAPPVIRLGQAELLVREVRTTPGSHPWASYTSWAGLVEQARPDEEIALEFASPTAFGFGQKEWGKQIVVLPQPELVFGSLLRSWNALAPEPLCLERAALLAWMTEHVVVKRIDGLNTEMLHFSHSPQVGFTGRVTYGLMGPDPGMRRQLNALADLAFYCGVGMKTTMGMGQCRRVRHDGR
jgi:CRISPR-associated endoribonuclease Cas6